MPAYGFVATRGHTRRASTAAGNRGFTLAEFLVAFSLFAVLSAIAIPAVVTQTRKAEVSSVMKQLEDVGSGINTFVADIKNYPASVDQLVYEPGSGTTADEQYDDGSTGGNHFPPGHLKNWDGPYLDIGYISGSLPTGMNGSIKLLFGKECIGRATYMTVVVTGLSDDAMKAIDLSKDRVDDPVDGLIRYTTGTTGSLSYLAVTTGSAPKCS